MQFVAIRPITNFTGLFPQPSLFTFHVSPLSPILFLTFTLRILHSDRPSANIQSSLPTCTGEKTEVQRGQGLCYQQEPGLERVCLRLACRAWVLDCARKNSQVQMRQGGA